MIAHTLDAGRCSRDWFFSARRARTCRSRVHLNLMSAQTQSNWFRNESFILTAGSRSRKRASILLFLDAAATAALERREKSQVRLCFSLFLSFLSAHGVCVSRCCHAESFTLYTPDQAAHKRDSLMLAAMLNFPLCMLTNVHAFLAAPLLTQICIHERCALGDFAAKKGVDAKEYQRWALKKCTWSPFGCDTLTCVNTY